MKVKKPVRNPIQEKLIEYERLTLEISRLRDKHSAIFEALDQMEQERAKCVEDSKRLIHSNKQPPPGTKFYHQSTARPASGQFFCVQVTYRRNHAFYDPAKLPKDVLTKPGVIASVNTEAIAALEDERCASALQEGDWITPSVTIKRLTEDGDSNE